MNRADRKAVAVCAILLLGCLILIVCGITAHVQRRSAQSRMVEHAATVTDLVANRSGKTTTWDAYITYVVNGVEYTRELGNDTTVAVSADGNLKDIVPYKENSYWRALVVPQDIIGTKIIKVTVGSDVYTLNQTVTFEPNKQHKCTLKINRIGEGVNISIGGWESADTDFGGTLE